LRSRGRSFGLVRLDLLLEIDPSVSRPQSLLPLEAATSRHTLPRRPTAPAGPRGRVLFQHLSGGAMSPQPASPLPPPTTPPVRIGAGIDTSRCDGGTESGGQQAGRGEGRGATRAPLGHKFAPRLPERPMAGLGRFLAWKPGAHRVPRSARATWKCRRQVQVAHTLYPVSLPHSAGRAILTVSTRQGATRAPWT
jgi:hypothetical protein